MNARTQSILFLLVLILPALPIKATLNNQLKAHPSPYLAMHGDDPVDWQTWGEGVLAQARAENKMLFISSGYFACHWCHVMQRESYRNPKTAALLNRYFIPVKVDRELEPALDAQLIDFVQKTRGHAGWPLNVFLTPDGYPLLGMTYVPPDQFSGLLAKLNEAWNKDSDRLASIARKAAKELAETQHSQKKGASQKPERLLEQLVASALELGDDMEGGFGRQNRFPMAPQLSVLLETHEHRPNPELARFLTLTLDQMATQGLRDHLAGGFFRYTVDQSWQVPHFEKMLYSQAQLIRLYIQAARVLKRPDYLDVARDTADFVIREMPGAGGAYMASFSAVDAEGREGGNYLWTEEQLTQVLAPDELALARKRWRLEGTPMHESGYLPVDALSISQLSADTGLSKTAVTRKLDHIGDKLLKARAQRELPRDDKQLAAWNGLMLSALVDAARTIGDVRYREAAQRLRNYLVGELWDGKQLLRARAKRGALGQAALEDYVYVAQGLSDLDGLSGKPQDQNLVLQLIRQSWQRFFDRRGWRGADQPLLPNPVLESAITDGPMPSPAALLIELSLNKAGQTQVTDLKALARRALEQSRVTVSQQPFWYATHVAALAR